MEAEYFVEGNEVSLTVENDLVAVFFSGESDQVFNQPLADAFSLLVGANGHILNVPHLAAFVDVFLFDKDGCGADYFIVFHGDETDGVTVPGLAEENV